jgi:succinate-semialdehyde dehydrogenase/glutarate-semialdehyde dehydrogenase
MNMYSDVSLFIDGSWGPAAANRTIDVVNPATGEKIGTVPHASISDLDRALEAAEKGFRMWRKISAYDRSKIMRKAADILRERADHVSRLMTMEQGKPVAEARGEVLAGADVIDWFAEEARRAYGRVIPARAEGEFPDQSGGAEIVRRTGRGLLDHREGAGGNSCVPG